MLELRTDSLDGELLSNIAIPATTDWTVLSSKLPEVPVGIHDLIVILKSGSGVEVDWLMFE
jgi:hypothetical protein